MKLQKLLIKRFGRFEDFAVDFSDGFNLIIGDNDSGKSTLVRAICTALFDVPSATRTDTHYVDLESPEPPYLVHLEYEADGKSYRLTKDLATELILLEEIETGSKWNSPAAVKEQIALALGFSEKELYRATSLALQGDLAGVDSATDLIRDKLEKMLNNNKDDLLVSRLLQRIGVRLGQIQGTEAEPAGEIRRYEKRVQDWSSELDVTKTKVVELLEARQRKETIGSELQVARKLFEDKHDLFRKSKLALEAEQNLNQERESYLDLGRRTRDAQEIKNQITSKKEALKAMTKIERSDLKSAENMATQIQLLQGRVEDASTRLEKEEEHARSSQTKGWYRILLAVALLATVVCGFMWNKQHDMLFLGGAAAGVITAVMTIALWTTATTTYRRALTKQREAESHLLEEKQKLENGSEALRAALRKFKVEDVDEMAEHYEEYRDLDRDIKSMVSRYESLLGDNNLKDLENELEQVTNRISQQQDIFNKYRAYAISPEKLEQLQRELAELDKKLTQFDEENSILENKLQYLEAGSDLMAPLQERIEEGERHLKRLRSEAEVLSIVSRYLEEARRRVLKSSIEILEDEASVMLRGLTANQWQQVRLDRHTLAAEISADHKTWVKSSGELSCGTADALHLALRLALVKVMSGDNKPPIVLEDPLLQFDSRRRQAALSLMRELSEDYQVLFFTAAREAQTPPGRVIDLDRGAAVAEPGTPAYAT